MASPPAPEPGTLTSSDLGSACTVPFDIKPFMDLAVQPNLGQTLCMSQARSGPFHLVNQAGSGVNGLTEQKYPGAVVSFWIETGIIFLVVLSFGAMRWRGRDWRRARMGK